LEQNSETRERTGVTRIEKREYRGWPKSYFLSNDCVELVVLADVGLRVIRYARKRGENQFHEFQDQVGWSGGGEFRLYGGHRLWVWPADNSFQQEKPSGRFPEQMSGLFNPAGWDA
jgi:hypothetical protein